MFTVGHIFPVYTAGMVGGCAEWTMPRLTDVWRWTGPPVWGKEGWFGREGQPPGPSMIVTHLTQVGVIIRLGDNRRMAPIDPDGPRKTT